jgi:flavin reductase (DIM6/NTAB) family NADH-FMN oxidoreductase RutF
MESVVQSNAIRLSMILTYSRVPVYRASPGGMLLLGIIVNRSLAGVKFSETINCRLNALRNGGRNGLMEIDFEEISRLERYRFLTHVVVPRPIAWVSTLSESGVLNAAPFSFFNVFGSDPAFVALGIGDRKDGRPKDTVANIEMTEEFVINIVTEKLAKRMVQTSYEYGPEENELDAVSLTTSPSVKVKPPRIEASPAHLECRKLSIQKVGGNHLVLGTVVHGAVDDEFYDERAGLVETRKMLPIGRMHGSDGYTRTSDQFYIEKP